MVSRLQKALDLFEHADLLTLRVDQESLSGMELTVFRTFCFSILDMVSLTKRSVLDLLTGWESFDLMNS